MKANCRALKLAIKICIITFVLIGIFTVLVLLNAKCKLLEILLNIFIGLFGSGCIALLLAIPAYKVCKTQLINKYLQEATRITMKISNIKFLFSEYTSDTIVSYVNELKSRVWKEEFKKISKESVFFEDEKYKEELKKEFISHRPTLEEKISSLGLQQYAEESVNKDIEKLRKDAKKIYETYKLLSDVLNKIKEESYHFELYLAGEGNEAVSLEKLFDIQREIFEVETRETGEYKNYVINNRILNIMLVKLEKIRADIFNVAEEKITLYPVECRSYSKKY